MPRTVPTRVSSARPTPPSAGTVPTSRACNRRSSWISPENAISRLFAVEYAALFDGLLPALAMLNLPLPLGGTSNHFRRQVLDEIGGWDPFNVTEDADIGIRLARFGHRTATLDLPTLEEAPDAPKLWIKQRTRWFKGWLQTWLVHTRRPLATARQLGWRGALGFNLVVTAVVVSAMVHPLYLATLAVMATHPLMLWGNGGVLAAVVVGVNLFNLCAAYAAMTLLTRRALALRGRIREAWVLVLLPIYWLMMSVACYRAVGQLFRRPHHWEKTPHRGRRMAEAPRTPSPVVKLVRSWASLWSL